MFRAARPLLRLSPGASLASSLSRRHAPPRGAPKLLVPALPQSRSAFRFASSTRGSGGGSGGGGGDKKSSKAENPPPPKQPIDHEHEMKVAQEKLQPRPHDVSSQSSVRHVLEGSGQSNSPEAANLSAGLKHDIGIVRDTFRLTQVPKESHILGLAGTIPYLATSLSTVFLAWDLTKQVPTGNRLYDAVFIPHDTAQHLLGVIEPLQLGYGAVIISFLGAIHWGLEYAEKETLRERTRFRYGMGVAASVVAWPTLFLPFETALTSQFMAFVALYFADSRAAARGWAPSWYGMYRFLLTVMVGLAILVSLVGRASISQHGRLTKQGLSSTMETPGMADRHTNWAKLEAEEKEKLRKEKEEAEKKAKKEAKKNKDDKAGKKEEGKEGTENKESKETKEAKEGKEQSGDPKGGDAKNKPDKSDKGQQSGSKDADESENAKKDKDDKKEGDDNKAEDGSGQSNAGKSSKEDGAEGESGDKPKDGKEAAKGGKK